MVYAWVEGGHIFAVERLEDVPEQYKNSYIIIDDVPIHLISQYYIVEGNQIKRKNTDQLLENLKKEKLAELNQKYYAIVHQYLELNILNLNVNELTELDKRFRLQYQQLKEKILNSNAITDILTLNINFEV